MTFQIMLAGRTIQIESIHEQVYHMCRKYLLEDRNEHADIYISMEEQDIEYEREKATKEYDTSSWYSAAYLETLAVYRKIATAMLDYNSWLMHGAVLSVQDNAYMLTASSGTGKTTLLNIILKHIEGSYVVNGDKPLLQMQDDRILACGTPWSGKEHMDHNCQVPLKAIIILQRGDTNKAEKLSFSQAFPILLQQTYKPESAMLMKKTLELLYQMASHGVSFYRLTIKRYDHISDLDNDEVCEILKMLM